MSKQLFILALAIGLVVGQLAAAQTPVAQDAGADGIVSIQAEDFDDNTTDGTRIWEFNTDIAGFTGDGFMRAVPDGSGSGTPQLDFNVEFVKTGIHYVWVRGYRTSGTDDSCHVGLDGDETTSDRIQAGGTDNKWEWSNNRRDSQGRAFVDVTSLGVHVLHVRMREDGWRFDKIVLTTDENFTPADEGPPESTRGPQLKAGGASPGDGVSDIPWYIDELGWSAGAFARTHNVYFGTNFADVNDRSAAALVGEGLTEASQAIQADLETTYYWAVDEVNGAPDFTVYAGDTWSFTVEALANLVTNVSATADSQFAADTGPDNVVNGSGLTDGLHSTSETDMWLTAGLPATIQFDFDQIHSLHEMHVWNQNQLIEGLLGFSAKDVTLEVSANGTDFTAVEGVGPLNQGAATPAYAANTTIALGGVQAMSVRMTITSGYGFLTQVGLSEVQFTSIPAFPREFSPANGVETDGLDVTLSWRAGRFAAEHQVLLSQDQAAVTDGSAVIATTAEKSLALSGLEYGNAYFTQIIDVASDGSTYPGPINIFFTPAAQAIDDMEAYADEENKEIWATWADGFDDPANGSLVGNGASGTPETDEVYEGGQSLPMEYDLTSASLAEATRTFSPALDLTAGAPDTLGIYFKGDAAELNGFYSLNGNTWTDMSWNPQKVATSGDMLIGLALTSHAGATPATAAFSNVSTTGNVSGDWTQTDIGGTHPAGLFTEAGGSLTLSAGGADIWGTNDEFRFVHKTLTGDGSITAKVDSLETADAWTKGGVMIRDTADTGSSFGAVYATGTNGTRYQARLAAGVDAVSDTPVLDGVQQLTEEPVWVRLERKTLNVSAGVYMTLTDTSGRSVKVSHPDPAATLLSDWTLFSVSIGDLSGVTVSSIRSITLGVEGAGATGKIFADYLHVSIDNPSPDTVLGGLSAIGASPGDVVTWFEAESGEITGPLQVFTDDRTASAGEHIGTEDGIGNQNGNPPADGVATYSFNVPEDGVYRLAFRVIITGGSDSFWVRIPGMVTNTTNHDSGWVRFNGIQPGDRWHWDEVQSWEPDESFQVVDFTLSAGTHTLEIARREDGALLDAIAVLK